MFATVNNDGAPQGSKVFQDFYPVGANVFVRCVTFYYTGRVVANDGIYLRLTDATWVAETGNFNNALKEETFSESESYVGDVVVNVGAIVDGTVLNTTPMPKKR